MKSAGGELCYWSQNSEQGLTELKNYSNAKATLKNQLKFFSSYFHKSYFYPFLYFVGVLTFIAIFTGQLIWKCSKAYQTHFNILSSYAYCQAQPNWLTKAANWTGWFYYHNLHYPTGRQAGRPEKYFLAKIELGHQIQSCFPRWVNIKNVFKP